MSARLIMKMRVAEATLVSADVLHLRLVHPKRPELPSWTAGAHVDLRLPDGRTRQYSLCGDPTDASAYEIAIKREDAGRGASRWAHQALSEGSEAHVSAPRNNFPLKADARRTILVAGGIGVTPVLAMAHELAAAQADFTVHACFRDPERAPLLPVLRDVCGARLTTWFSGRGRRFDAAALGPPGDGVQVYACGPARLLDALRAGLAEAGWPDAQVHAEAFAALVDENFKPEPFDVRLASTGEMVHVPADRSMLDALKEHGLTLPSSCGIGVCGSCICRYLDGTAIHRDSVIPPAERQDRIAPCVSRARVAMTLDL